MAILETQLPQCFGGKITIMSYDYWAEPITYSAKKSESGSIEMQVYPVKTLNASVLKKSVIKSDGKWSFKNSPAPLDKDAEAIVFITKVKEDPLDSDIVSSFIFNGTIEIDALRLVPGSYEVMITNLLHKTIDIPEEEKCESGSFYSGDECVTLEAMTFEDPFPFGGVNFDNTYFEEFDKTAYAWNITAEDLYSSEGIRFYTIAVPDGFSKLTHDDLLEMSKVSEYSARFRQKLEPEFI